MRKIFNKTILVLLFGFTLYNCVSYKNQLFEGKGGIEQARINIITDFANTYKTPRSYLKEREGKPFDVFWVTKNKINGNAYVFSVLPDSQGYIPLKIEDSLGKVPNSYFPNRYEVEKGKLFLWKDSITPLRRNILNVMNKYGILDSTDIKRELGLLPDDFEDTRMVIIDDGLKGVDYYICKNHIEKYKKIVTNKAVGYYTPPKLKCNNK